MPAQAPAGRTEAARALVPCSDWALPAQARAELAPPGRAGGSRPATAATEPSGTEPCRAAARLPARGRLAERRKAGHCCLERPDPAPGGWALPAPKERLRAADSEPSGTGQSDADRCHRTGFRAHWAVSATHRGERAKVAARSAPEPAAAAHLVRPRARAARLVAPVARPDRERHLQAAPDGAAARARPGWPAVPPAAWTGDVARWGPLLPGAPARQGGQQAAGPVRDVRRGVPDRLDRGAPGHRGAGGADPAGRHPTGPGRAGAMERRNCPATA